jgi:glycosyltransferase involved in cell wall biosynthesis
MAGVHSVSSYVEQVTVRDFIRRGDLLTRVIPSFSEESDTEGDPGEIARIVDRLPREPFILFVGALRTVKGVATLVEAYGRLRDAPPLVLLGTVEQDTPRAFPEGVVALEDAPHGAVMQAWERCLFGVAPSLWPEPLGLVVHEGMSRGKCVVGTAPGGHADLIVPDESGLLVPPGDPAALAAAMQRLLDDPELRERLGAAARDRSVAATAAGTRDAYARLFRDAAAAPAR